jgi:hypothetical protein
MSSAERTSSWMAVASPPAVVISRATVVMVEAEELGSGGKGAVELGSEMVLAATTTVGI